MPTAAYERYMRMRRLFVRLHDDDPRKDILADAMDPLWYDMTNRERAAIKQGVKPEHVNRDEP